MSGDAWMFPKLGHVDVAKEALDFVSYVLTKRPRPAATSSAIAETATSEDIVHLVDLISALVNVAAVLAQIGGALHPTMSATDFVDLLRVHQTARADLDSLDGGLPFDA